jgi:hypothetical protein
MNAARPRLRHRVLAAIVLVATAWTALWPLVSAAHARMASEAMPLCHQAGMAVAPDQPAQGPGDPSHPAPRFHCPLCIMAVYAGFSAPPQVTPPAFRCRMEVRDVYCAPAPGGVSIQLPQGRAPPVLA